MYVGNVGAAFAAYVASKRPSVSKTTEPAAEEEAVVNVELPADAGLTEARAQITARDI